MTGELTLSGRILPVGGIKEKIIAAKRSHIKEIILPRENEKDTTDIPSYITKGLKLHFVSEMEDALQISINDKIGKNSKPKEKNIKGSSKSRNFL